MNGIRHPFTRALYERDGDGDVGNVRVTGNGVTGLFTSEGQWIEGDLREADPQLCGWVGGRRIGSHRLATS